MKLKHNFASARAVPVKITTAQASSATMNQSDGPTTQNQKRFIDQAIDKLDAKEYHDEGDEGVPEDDQTMTSTIFTVINQDLESISNDYEGENLSIPSCKLQGLNWALLSAIYAMCNVKFIHGTTISHL